MKEIIDQMKEWSTLAAGVEAPQPAMSAAQQNADEEMKDDGEPKKLPTDDELTELLEELLELAEIHPRNNLNVCLMGGMQEILSLIFSHQSK